MKETSRTLTPGEMSGNALPEKEDYNLERDSWGKKRKKLRVERKLPKAAT